MQCSGLCNVPMGHGKERPTQEIERDLRVGHPSSLQARGTREENEGRKRTTGTREKRTKKKTTRTRTRRRQQHDAATSIRKRGTNPHSSQRARGGRHIPVKETLRENGQQRTREREKENKPKKKQREDLAHRKPGAMGEGGGDVVPHMS